MNHHAAPAYSIGKTQLKSIDQLCEGESIGPGPIYRIEDPNKRAQCHTIGKSSRAQLIDRHDVKPGPCEYNPEKIKQTVAHKIPKSQRTKTQGTPFTPDPAWYRPEEKMTRESVPTFSMGTRYDSLAMNEANPGPGYYETSVPKDSRIQQMNKTLFGRTNRFQQPKQVSPGPGDYHADKMKPTTGRPAIGTGQRLSPPKQITPGPNQYNKKSQFDAGIANKLGKTFSARFKSIIQADLTTSNAFNNYFQDKEGSNKRQGFSIGKSRRKVFQGRNIPGPTDYCTDYETKEGVHVSVPKSVREPFSVKQSTPGPGTYPINPPAATAYTIPRSQSQKTIITNPGVGHYELSKYKTPSHMTSTGSLIPKSQRTSFISKNPPGVGDYNIVAVKLGNITMPKADRFAKMESTRPGPGDYHIHSTLANLHFYRRNKPQ